MSWSVHSWVCVWVGACVCVWFSPWRFPSRNVSQCFACTAITSCILAAVIDCTCIPSMTYVDMLIIQYYCRKISYLTMPLPLLPFSVFWRTVPWCQRLAWRFRSFLRCGSGTEPISLHKSEDFLWKWRSAVWRPWQQWSVVNIIIHLYVYQQQTNARMCVWCLSKTCAFSLQAVYFATAHVHTLWNL